MSYYKVIQNGKVIDANEIFLKWQRKHGIMLSCEVEEAQFIQSHDGETIWRVMWLNPAPQEAGTYDAVEAALITRQEYDDLRAVLDEGEEVIEPEPTIPEPDPEPAPDPDDPQETERPMTVAQMRKRIIELEQELEATKILLGVE